MLHSINRREFIGTAVAASAVTLFPSPLPATEPVDLPEVALIGDSIRLGYAPAVAEAFAGRCTIFSPKENGEHSVNLLKYAHLWISRRKSRVIHLNAGLHDIRTLKYGEPAGRTLVSIDCYRENVRRLLSFILEETKATPIWATTTPVVDEDAEAEHRQWNDFSRHNEDVVRYNAAATEVCRQLGVKINDLYQLVADTGPRKLQLGDGVHYSVPGYEFLGREVVDAIRSVL